MRLVDIFLTIVYDHYCSMQKRGRRVVPWLYTSFVVALLLTICLTCIADIIQQIHLKETIFLPAFIVVYLFFFFLIKRYYFDSGKNLILLERYLNQYSPKRRLYLKVIVLTVCSIVPFLLVFIIWFKAK
jgi:hypothetical protein